MWTLGGSIASNELNQHTRTHTHTLEEMIRGACKGLAATDKMLTIHMYIFVLCVSQIVFLHVYFWRREEKEKKEQIGKIWRGDWGLPAADHPSSVMNRSESVRQETEKWQQLHVLVSSRNYAGNYIQLLIVTTCVSPFEWAVKHMHVRLCVECGVDLAATVTCIIVTMVMVSRGVGGGVAWRVRWAS